MANKVLYRLAPDNLIQRIKNSLGTNKISQTKDSSTSI